jgi:hypothetical protein
LRELQEMLQYVWMQADRTTDYGSTWRIRPLSRAVNLPRFDPVGPTEFGGIPETMKSVNYSGKSAPVGISAQELDELQRGKLDQGEIQLDD